MIVEQEILHMIGKKFFADPDSFVESYVMGHETLKGGLRRSHSDIVLKTPVQLAPDQYILTIELR
jgi:hypothetical protein